MKNDEKKSNKNKRKTALLENKVLNIYRYDIFLYIEINELKTSQSGVLSAHADPLVDILTDRNGSRLDN